MLRRFPPLLAAVFTLTGCTLADGDPVEVPAVESPSPDLELAAWLDEYCGLDQAVPQEVRDVFDPALAPTETTDADREPLIAALTALDEAVAAVDAAAEALPPAPEAVGEQPITDLRSHLSEQRAFITEFLQTAAAAPGVGLVSLYEAGPMILDGLGAERTFGFLPMLDGDVSVALPEAPNCAPAVAVYEGE
jgi:hypothetical protein